MLIIHLVTLCRVFYLLLLCMSPILMAASLSPLMIHYWCPFVNGRYRDTSFEGPPSPKSSHTT